MEKSKAIEVNVISAEGLLKNRRQPVKKRSRVVVKSDPLKYCSTGFDREGGSYPVWKEKLLMELPLSSHFITVEVHSDNRVVGSTNIPVSDFLGGYLPENYLSFLSYRLRGADGYKNGIVNLSVMVKGSDHGGDRGGAGVTAVADGKVGDHGVVLGIPVGYKWQ